MRFIGQHHIMRQFKFILPDLFKNTDKGANILLKGPSGYGKTELALKTCKYLAGESFHLFNGEDRPFSFTKRVVFIDEIHQVTNLERLYHIMDSGRFVMIFATNLDGNLPEAFVNRCYEFILEEYDEDELILIARGSSSFSASDEQFLEIVKAGNNNPRIIKSICRRLEVFFRENPSIPVHSLNFKDLMENVFEIRDGLDPIARKYLEILEMAGGRASLSLLVTLLHTDRGSITRNIEPVLIKKNLIEIKSTGRILINGR